MRGISCDVLPIPDHAFFEQAVLQRRLGQRLLELARLCPQHLHLVGGGLTCRVAGQPPLAGLQELLRPAVIHALCNTLFAAELGDAGFATQSFQNNADLLFGRILPPRCSADIPHRLLGAVGSHGSCSHRRLLRRYDEPELLLYAISSFCPAGPDGGQSIPSLRQSSAMLASPRNPSR